MYGDKIAGLNLAVSNLLEGFKEMALVEPPEIAVVTFGGEPKRCPFMPFGQVNVGWEAGGKTRLSEALKLATELMTDETIMLIITDGAPQDGEYKNIELRGHTYCMAIGYDADIELLEELATNPSQVVSPDEAQHLPGYWYAMHT